MKHRIFESIVRVMNLLNLPYFEYIIIRKHEINIIQII